MSWQIVFEYPAGPVSEAFERGTLRQARSTASTLLPGDGYLLPDRVHIFEGSTADPGGIQGWDGDPVDTASVDERGMLLWDSDDSPTAEPDDWDSLNQLTLFS